jgi:ABC-type multidrug transport system ATPase subunit
MNHPDTILLEAKQLSRNYGTFHALYETDFQLTAGKIIVLTGVNGAGKTTLLHTLSGLLRPSSGTVVVGGFDLYREERQAKQKLAFVPDVPRFYTELTAWEHLQFFARAFNSPDQFELKTESLLKEFNLWDARDLFPHNYSRGMRLKLGILMALIRPFKVLILDEPASALDPEGTALLVNKLTELKEQGAAILLTSHNQDFSSQLGNEVWRMQQGHLEIVS